MGKGGGGGYPGVLKGSGMANEKEEQGTGRETAREWRRPGFLPW